VLDVGSITELGTHEQFVALDGTYRSPLAILAQQLTRKVRDTTAVAGRCPGYLIRNRSDTR